MFHSEGIILEITILNNPNPDESLNDVNESLVEIETSQNDLSHALGELTAEVGSLSANASCEEISKFNVIEDGYYMKRIQIGCYPLFHSGFHEREILNSVKDTAIIGVIIIQSSLQIQYNHQ